MCLFVVNNPPATVSFWWVIGVKCVQSWGDFVHFLWDIFVTQFPAAADRIPVLPAISSSLCLFDLSLSHSDLFFGSMFLIHFPSSVSTPASLWSRRSSPEADSCRLIWERIFRFQRGRCIQLHVYPGRQCHLPHFRAEHHGRGHGPWRRVCSRCLLGELFVIPGHIGVILTSPSDIGYLSSFTFRLQPRW